MLLEEIHFKRKDGKQLIHIALDVLDAIFFPRPYFGRDIIKNRDASMRLNIFGNFQVEPRIVNQNQYIRLPTDNILLAKVHVPENRTQMQ